ncbi:MAG: hypothetical protein DLM60_17250 [Pseudonocardiales bacterium]|nr:MAG: hypothetical protein DLM60_17250 [Pseudonocardiales bacterium]
MPHDDFQLPEQPRPYVQPPLPPKRHGTGWWIYGFFAAWICLGALISNGWSINFMVITIVVTFVGTPLLGAALFAATKSDRR